MMLPTLPAFGQPSAPPPLRKTSVSDEAHERIREDIALRLGRCAYGKYHIYKPSLHSQGKVPTCRSGKVGMRCGWARYNKARKIGLTVAWFPELTFCKTFLLLSITIIGTLNLCLFAGDFPPAPSIPQKKNQITMSTTFQRPCSPTQARHSPSPARRKRV